MARVIHAIEMARGGATLVLCEALISSGALRNGNSVSTAVNILMILIMLSPWITYRLKAPRVRRQLMRQMHHLWMAARPDPVEGDLLHWLSCLYGFACIVITHTSGEIIAGSKGGIPVRGGSRYQRRIISWCDFEVHIWSNSLGPLLTRSVRCHVLEAATGIVYAIRKTQIAEHDRRIHSLLHQRFRASASHELRTPVAVIDGCAQTILERWAVMTDVDRWEFVTAIRAHSARLRNVVERVLVTKHMELQSPYTHFGNTEIWNTENVLSDG